MQHRGNLAFWALLSLILSTAWPPAVMAAAAGPCAQQRLAHDIPERPSGAPTGSEFARQVAAVSEDDRESAILGQLLTGNVPEYLRRRVPVTLRGVSSEGWPVAVTLCVTPDYLALGNDRDFLYVPMRLGTALRLAARYDFVLPTRKIVDAIYQQARIRLQPQPLPAGDTMRTTAYYLQHNELVREQRAEFELPLGTLTAGDKKDLVLTSRLWTHPERVAIYGWHRLDGIAIQPLSIYHGARYADYSHGVRLVSAVAYLDGKAVPVYKILQDPRLAPVLSDEGAIAHPANLVDLLRSYKTAAVLGSARWSNQGSSVLQQRNPR